VESQLKLSCQAKQQQAVEASGQAGERASKQRRLSELERLVKSVSMLDVAVC